MNKIFNFDKEKFRREQDQMRELAKETKRGKAAAQSVKTTIDESDFGVKALAGIAALALFARQMGMNTDILKLQHK